MNENYCVYKHIRLDTNQTFYIGKGNVKRPYSKTNRNKYWQNIVNKHGYIVQIIKDNLSNNDAFLLEHKLIILYKKYNRAECNLNLEFGIGGRLGRTDDDYKEIGIKISKKTKGTRLGKNNSNFGNKYSEESRLKLSKSLKGKLIGVCQSKEHIHNRTFKRRKKVINILTNEILYVNDLIDLLNKSKSHIVSQLNGRVPNKTNFEYYYE